MKTDDPMVTALLESAAQLQLAVEYAKERGHTAVRYFMMLGLDYINAAIASLVREPGEVVDDGEVVH